MDIAATKGRRTLLIVDDVRVNRGMLKKIFASLYDILEAADGFEAMDRLRSNKVDAVILDLAMPGMDGYQVMEAMQADEELALIPVVVVTASDEKENLLRVLECGARDVIGKPYDAVLVQFRVANLLESMDAVRSLEQSRARYELHQSELYMSEHDALTGLYNRSAFTRRVREMVSAHPAGSFVMSYLDVDDFKVVNDRFGHEEGDRLLKFIADARREQLEAIGSYTCHDNADVFLSLLPNDRCIIDSITGELLEKLRGYDLPMRISVHIGRFAIDDPKADVSFMIDNAMLAVRSVKGSIDKPDAWFDMDMRRTVLRQQELSAQMHDALRDGQFVTFFQPQYNYSTGMLVSAETLVRWAHPAEGLISPGEFIPLSEKNGFILELDRFVWEQACLHMRRWLDAGLQIGSLSVNISRRDIYDPELPEFILSLVRKYGLEPSRLHLEITESAYVENARQLIGVARSLQELGFTVEMDDFGSGYSSLNTLKEVPVDILKLDLQFVKDTDRSDRSGRILSSVVRMAHWLKLPVIAEGVETLEKAEYLKSIGCSLMQGYYFSRPLPADEFEELLRGSRLSLEPFRYVGTEAPGAVDYLDASAQSTLLFNSFVGGAYVAEYDGSNVEILRANDGFFREIGRERDSYQPHMLNLLERFYPESRDAYLSALKEAIATGRESACELHSFPLTPGGREIWTKNTMRFLAQNVNRFVFYSQVEDITERRELEALREKLRDANDRAQALIANIPGGVVTVVLRGGRAYTEFFSDGLCRMLGYTRDEMGFFGTEESMTRLTHPEDTERATGAVLDGMIGGTEINVELRLQKKSGGYLWVRLSGNPAVSSADGAVRYYCVCSDIDARRRQQEWQALERAKTEAAVETAGLVIWEYDIKSGTHRRLGGAGYAAFPMLVESAPEAVLEGGLVAECSRQDYLRLHEEVRAGRKTCSADVLLRRDEGFCWQRLTYNTVFSNGKPVSAIGVISDISAETEALARQRELELALESSSLYFWTHDLINGNYPVVNKNAQRLGIGRMVGGSPVGLLDSGCLLPGSRRALATLLNNLGGDGGNLLLHMDRARSGVEWLRLTYAIIRGADGRPASIVMAGDDISARVESERNYNAALSSMSDVPGEAVVARISADLNNDRLIFGEGEFAAQEQSYSVALQRVIDSALTESQRGEIRMKLSRERLIEAYRRGEDTMELRYQRLLPGHRVYRWLRMTAQQLTDEKTGLLMSFQNTTDIDDEVMGRRIADAVADRSFDILGVIDVGSGRIRIANKGSASEVVSIEQESLYDDNISKLAASLIREDKVSEALESMKLDTVLSALEKGETYSVSLPLRSGDGWRHKLWKYFWLDSDRTSVIITRVDVSEAESLRERGEELRDVMAAVSTEILDYDIKTHTLTVPESYAERYGITTVLENIPWDARRISIGDRESYEAFYGRMIAGEAEGSAVLQFVKADGSPRWEELAFVTVFDGEGRPERAVLSVRDATEQHIQQIETERNRTIIRAGGVCIFDYDMLSDLLHWESAEESGEYQRIEIPDYYEKMHERPAIHPDHVAALRGLIDDMRKSPSSGVLDYVSDNWGDGYQWSRLHYAAITDGGGKTYRIVGQVSRIQEEKDKERLLSELQERLGGGVSLGRYDAPVLEAAFRLMYGAEDMREAIDAVLALLGEHYGVDRAYIFEDSSDHRLSSNTFEWCAPGVEPMIDMLQDLSYERDLGGAYRDLFDENGVFIMESLDDVAPPIRDVLEPQGVRSMLQCAIRENGVLCGFIGFDDCTGEARWTPEQSVTMSLVSMMLGVFLLRFRHSQETEFSEEFLASLENNSDYIYLLEGDSFKVVYTNRAIRDKFDEDYVGVCCHEAFIGKDSPCEGCPAVRLRTEGVSGLLEVQRPDGIWISTQASTIHWKGRPVTMLSCRDISPQKEAESRLQLLLRQYEVVIKQGGKMVAVHDLKTRSSVRHLTTNSMALPEESQSMPSDLLDRGVVPPESREAFLGLYEQMYRGVPTGSLNVQLRLPGQERLRWVHMDYTLVNDENGVPAVSVISIFDNTEQVEKEQEYQRWQAGLTGLMTEGSVYMEVNVSTGSVEHWKNMEVLSPRQEDIPLSRQIQLLEKEVTYPEDAAAVRVFFDAARLRELFLEGVTTDRIRFRVIEDGVPLWRQAEARLVRSPVNNEIKAFISFSDVDEEEKERRRLIAAAERDSMTGLYNRAASEKHINEELSSGSGRRCALLMIDLDNLKTINDSMGHAQGDRALLYMAETLRSHFRATDVIGRMGGDEFIVLLTDISSAATLRGTMASFMRRISQHMLGEKNDYQLHGSVGVTFGVTGQDDFMTLYRQADMALSHVKTHGKNSFIFYEPEMERGDYVYAPQTVASLAGQWYAAGEDRRLAEALNGMYTLVISGDLTRNTYRLVQYEDFIIGAADVSGSVDELVELCAATLHPDDRESFKAILGREPLLRARERGESVVSLDLRCGVGENGWRPVRLDAVFVDGEGGGVGCVLLGNFTDGE